MDYHCGQCGRPVNTAGHCPSCSFDRTGADVEPSPRDVFNIAVKTAVKLDAIETRLARIERELATQDRVLTELRRELALTTATAISAKYDATKPLPGVMPTNKGDER